MFTDTFDFLDLGDPIFISINRSTHPGPIIRRQLVVPKERPKLVSVWGGIGHRQASVCESGGIGDGETVSRRSRSLRRRK